MATRALVAQIVGTTWDVEHTGIDLELHFNKITLQAAGGVIALIGAFDAAEINGTLTLHDTVVTDADYQPWNLVGQNSKSAAYTTVLSDAGKQIIHPSSDNNARTFTIDSNANVAYPIGTCLTFINMINTVTIAITSDTMTMAGSGSTGSRTLAANGIATAVKIGTTSWLISGTGLT